MPDPNTDPTRTSSPDAPTGDQPAGVAPEAASFATGDADALPEPTEPRDVAQFAEQGDPLGDEGLQQGATNSNRARDLEIEIAHGQGPKTRAGNQQRLRTGTAEEG